MTRELIIGLMAFMAWHVLNLDSKKTDNLYPRSTAAENLSASMVQYSKVIGTGKSLINHKMST